MPGRNLYVAVPAVVNCGVASKAESSQCAAAASQKFTCPGFTGVEPETTVAVRVTTVPAATEVTSLPKLVTVSVVVVAAAVAHARGTPKEKTASIAWRTKARIAAGRETDGCPGRDRQCIAGIIVGLLDWQSRPKSIAKVAECA